MYPLQHIRMLRKIARQFGLDASVSFWAATDYELQQAYNGIGSDKFKFLLAPTTRLFWLFEAAALIHDWDWGPGNLGTEEAWKFANHRFRCNCRILAAHTSISFGWFRPQIRKTWRWEGDTLADIVSTDMCLDIYQDYYNAHNDPEPGPEVMHA